MSWESGKHMMVLDSVEAARRKRKAGLSNSALCRSVGIGVDLRIGHLLAIVERAKVREFWSK